MEVVLVELNGGAGEVTGMLDGVRQKVTPTATTTTVAASVTEDLAILPCCKQT